MMKKCPFCGADIEESARFCLYCMQSLTEKEQIHPHPPQKMRWLLIVTAVAITLLTLIVAWFCIHPVLNNGTPSVPESSHIPAAAVTENYIDSSCTQTGSYDEVVYCSLCQEQISRTQKTVAKKIHIYNQNVTSPEYLKAEATHTDIAVYYCSCACGEKGSATFTSGSVIPHVFDQKNTASAYLKSSATCTEPAAYYYSCVCGVKGNTAFTDGEASGHSYALTWAKNATHHWHKATCEHTAEISGEAEHNYGADNICDTCGYDRTVNVSDVTLNFSSLSLTVDDIRTLIATITPSNATNQNVKWESSNASVVSVDANGKLTALGAGTATVTVTAEDGIKTAQCTVSVSEKICPHTAEKTELENVVDSTCEDAGSYDEVLYCSACGDELSRTKKTIPSTGHTFGKWEIVQAPSCTDKGLKLKACSCGEKETEEISEKGHSFDGWVTDKIATCMETGACHRTCTACGEVQNDIIPADPSAHKYDTNWTGDDSFHWHKCLNTGCTSISEKNEHIFGSWMVDSVATCVQSGTRYHICSDCQRSVSETYSAPSNHSYDTEWTVNATYHWYACSRCNATAGKKRHSLDGSGKCYVCGYQTMVPNDGIVYMISDDGTYAEVIDYTASDTSVVIAAEYGGVPVTKIGKYAFQEKNITSIEIPDSITSIGDFAFQYCRSLSSVTMGNSVASIGNYAFACCALTDVTIPNSVKSIGMAAFYANSNLARVKIGSGVTTIDMHAFKGCYKLASVTIPNGVERIEDGVFSDCFSLTSVKLGDNVTYIGNEAFYCCSKLTNITIPDSITVVGSDAFYACYNATEKVNGVTYVKKIVIDVDNAVIVEIREGTKVIAANAFSGCRTKLRKVIMPDSVVSIGSGAFSLCQNLESVTMSDNLKIIGDRAFNLCTNLSSIVIPSSVTHIDHQAFYWCESLVNIKYCGTEAQWEAISKGFMWDEYTNYTLTYNYIG